MPAGRTESTSKLSTLLPDHAPSGATLKPLRGAKVIYWVSRTRKGRIGIVGIAQTDHNMREPFEVRGAPSAFVDTSVNISCPNRLSYVDA